MICRSCGTVGKGRRETPGSFGVELLLWICFIIPGVFYSLWRMTNKRRVCGRCGAVDLVPVDSPVGRRLLAEMGGGTP